MYCSNCGSAATGNFCSQCGSKIAAVATQIAGIPSVVAADWRFESSYDALVAKPWVKDRIAQKAAKARPGISGETVLDAFDKLTGNPIPSKTLAGVLQPLYGRMGISTGKTQDRVVRHPIGAAIVAGLCALAGNGHAVLAVQQCDNGCEVTAKLPSDMFALEGTLIVLFRTSDVGTHIEAATKIAGQWFDWGKSMRCLKRLFDAIEAELKDQQLAMSA